MIERARVLGRLDMAPAERPPSTARVIVATLLSLAGSLAADAVLVQLGTTWFPSTRGYAHFRFSDYGLLTVIGVLVACAAWPATTRVTSAPRWLFLRLAVVVTLVLWLPDVWLVLMRHESVDAVAVLMAMHLAIALITYNLLVHVAPTRPPAGDPVRSLPVRIGTSRVMWVAMVAAVGVEFGAGLAALFFVPLSRPDGWLPSQGGIVYVVHAALGAVLGAGAVAILLRSRTEGRFPRLGSWIGGVGVALGAIGGLLSASHSWRLAGMALMFVGTAVAFFGYLIPVLASGPGEEPG
jgi:hypothetical protein